MTQNRPFSEPMQPTQLMCKLPIDEQTHQLQELEAHVTHAQPRFLSKPVLMNDCILEPSKFFFATTKLALKLSFGEPPLPSYQGDVPTHPPGAQQVTSATVHTRESFSIHAPLTGPAILRGTAGHNNIRICINIFRNSQYLGAPTSYL